MDKESADRILKLINMTDEEFFESYVANDTLEEQRKFVEEFPEFKEIFEKNR